MKTNRSQERPKKNPEKGKKKEHGSAHIAPKIPRDKIDHCIAKEESPCETPKQKNIREF
jgi:hypothetical protein